MNADHGEEIVLHLDPGEPIRGRITFATGPALSFHGWLDLASKLERPLAGGRHHDRDTAPPAAER